MKQDTLVIGAAHLDIVGEHNSLAKDVLDKPGEIFYSVGGTAYNIATNIAQNGVPVKFVTLLRSDSLITPIILARLSSCEIDTSLVSIQDDVEESGFVAHRQDGALTSAVTASTMETYSMPESQLREAVESASLVVADCNISAVFLNRLQDICHRAGRKLIVSCVSESKGQRILQIERRAGVPYPFFAVSMCHPEALALSCDVSEDSTPHERIEHCRRIGAENIIITHADKGFISYDCTGNFITYPAPVIPKIVSVTGGGDALLASFCIYYARNRAIVWEEINKTIQRLVTAVLTVRGGTVGSQTRPNELKVVPKEEVERVKSEEREHFIKAFGEPMSIFGKKVIFGDFITVVSIGVAIIALLHQIGFG